MRPYLKTAAMVAGAVGDSPLFLIDYGLRLLRVLVLVALWQTILSDSARVGAMSLAAVLTYTLIAEVFNDQLATQTTMVEAFWEGNVVLRFLRPMGLVRQFAAEMSGRWLINAILFSIPLLLLAPILGVDPRPVSPQAGALFALSLGLGVLIGLAIDFLFVTFTVALDQPVWLVHNARVAVGALLSGSLLPLAYYPWGLGDIFSWLPFAGMAWAPLAVYTGAGDPLRLISIQLFWVVVLWPIATWLWRLGREKITSYGG
jgi:ABC-2 type transport system permease protein